MHVLPFPRHVADSLKTMTLKHYYEKNGLAWRTGVEEEPVA